MNALTFESVEALHANLEQQFQIIDEQMKSAEAAERHLVDILNHALYSQNTELCLSLIPYMDSEQGKLAYQYCSKTRRISTILRIIELESKSGKTLFVWNCRDEASLMEKYMLSLFALRRLLFRLSDSSAHDAIQYLRQEELSVFAVHLITQNDLIIPTPSLYEKIIAIYSGLWNDHDIHQLLYLIAHSITNKENYRHE
jgi:hypothetical protein